MKIKYIKLLKSKKLAKWTIVLTSIFVAQFLLTNLWVVYNANAHKVTVDSIPTVDCIIVPGAYVYPDGKLSDILKDRLDTALEIVEKNPNLKVLVSGDHGTPQYDEVNAMRKYLEGEGINPLNIFMDHAGFSTYDTIYRAKNIFKVNSAVVVTQDYHLKRATYLGRQMDMDVYGVPADKHVYVDIKKYKIRESLAISKDFMAVNILKPKSTYIGKEIPIMTSDAKSTEG